MQPVRCACTSPACERSSRAIRRGHASSRPSPESATESMSTERRDGNGLEFREVHRGAHPGDQFVRIARHKAFRKLGTGRYEIRGEPKLTGLTGAYTRLKRLVIGEPLATAAAGHERLTKLKALAVLSSDALSSVAYATEEIMRVLLLAGTAALSGSMPIGIVLVVLLFVVGFSYRQTIKAYPTGGGSYIVAKDNLGTLRGGAALTGVEAISDGVPAFQKPEWINAQKTLTAMVVILAVTFGGITYLANQMGIVPGVAEGGHDPETVVSQIARGVFGESPSYY